MLSVAKGGLRPAVIGMPPLLFVAHSIRLAAQIVFVRNMLEPSDGRSIHGLRNGDMAHRGAVGRTMPMPLAGGKPNRVPGVTSERALPSLCTQPRPETTIKICPAGCVCHAVRPPGSKVTIPTATRLGASDAIRPSRRTVPEKLSAGATVDGMEPALLIFNEVLPVFIHCLLAARRKVDIRAPGRVFAPRLNLRRALLPREGRAEPHALRIVPRATLHRALPEPRARAFRPG